LLWTSLNFTLLLETQLATMARLWVKKAYLELPLNQQLHYRYITQADSESPVIVFLHKSASSSASYERLMLHYAGEGFSCYAPDMPGFGGSFDPTDEQANEIQQQSTKWFTDIFLQAFEQLGITKSKFHIIGHHSGASLATQIAATCPELVASICHIGPTTIGPEERERMRKTFLVPFNEPVEDGSHLQKTWDYLERMGVGDSLQLRQRQAIDHIRAWRGRMLIYGAVWTQDSETLFAKVQCPVLVLCARDDVLWEHMSNSKAVKPDAKTGEVLGANFSPDLDADGIVREWDAFHKESAEKA
jgi:pimeloyl-ACP methyl ester carboxylesterase